MQNKPIPQEETNSELVLLSLESFQYSYYGEAVFFFRNAIKITQILNILTSVLLSRWKTNMKRSQGYGGCV